MQLGRCRRVRVLAFFRYVVPLAAALAVAGCNTASQQSPVAAAPQGATVAFESIDGPPRTVFDRLVRDLNAEAQQHQLAVTPRDGNAAYRVRGYLIAENSSKASSVSWVWDIYDRDHQRVMRINGEDVIPGKHVDAWQAVDDASVSRIARSSIEQLSAFLASAQTDTQLAVHAAYSSDSPEAAGILRIFQVNQSAPDPSGPEAVPVPPSRPTRASVASYSIAAAENRR